MALCVGSGCVGWGWTDITGLAPSLSHSLRTTSPPPPPQTHSLRNGTDLFIVTSKGPTGLPISAPSFYLRHLALPSHQCVSPHHMFSVSPILYTLHLHRIRGNIQLQQIICIWTGGSGIYVLKRYIYILAWTENMITNQYLGSFVIVAEKH